MNGIWENGKFVLASTLEDRMARLQKENQAMKEALEKVIKELRYVRDNDFDNWVNVLTPELMDAWTQVTRALILAKGGPSDE